jgi:hypothetical protein
MELDRAGREEARFPFTADVPDLAGPQVHLAGQWWDATIDEPTEGAREVVLLVAGPEAADNPAGTAVLPVGTHRARIRFTDDLEVIVRGGGFIQVW